MRLCEQILRKPLYVAFGQAMQGGGITSVDLVATRDAASVTMTASDGSAAPIASADGSNAGVMTAADKVRLDGLPDVVVRDFSTRLEVAAGAIGSGVSHARTAGYATAGDGGGALYKRVASEPSHSLKIQSADLAWWELVAEGGSINVLQAGADPTGVADSIQAFRDCVDFARFNIAYEQSGGANGPTIIVPQGKFHWSDTLEPHTAITMIGTKRGVDGNVGTIIEVAADKTGLILPKSDTLGAGRENPNDPLTKGANGSFIQGLSFRSLGGTDATKHGIHIRIVGVMLSHIEVQNFPGDGFHTRASLGGAQPDDLYGVANLWRFEHCYAFGNQRNGFFFSGSDVNAGMSMGLNAVQNGRWGLWDNAFLSNTHIAAHVQGNGHGAAAENDTNGVTSVVAHNSSRWAVIPGQESTASTTAPGTNAAVWHELISGGQAPTAQAPAWVSGNTYVAGGGYYFNGNGVKLGLSCYAEDDNWSVVEGNSSLRDGFNSFVHAINGGTRVRGGEVFNGGIVYHNEDKTTDLAQIKIMPPGDKDLALGIFYDGGPSSGLSFRWDNVKKVVRALATTGASSWPMEFLTDDSTINAGRGVGNEPGQGNINFPNGIFMGISSNARFLGNDSAAPTAGRHALGDTVLNMNSTVQTDTDGVDWVVLGWRCVITGTPGTWRPLWTRVSNPPGLV